MKSFVHLLLLTLGALLALTNLLSSFKSPTKDRCDGGAFDVTPEQVQMPVVTEQFEEVPEPKQVPVSEKQSTTKDQDLSRQVPLAKSGMLVVPKAPTVVVWMYPFPPTQADRLASNEVLVCAYQTACPTNTDFSYQRINLREITLATKYHTAVMNHALQKVIQLESYPDHVQSIAMLALLTKRLASCVRSWGDSKRVCEPDLDQYDYYHPGQNQTQAAPLIPTSKPDLSQMNFLTYRYDSGKRGNSGDEIQDLTGIQFQPYLTGLVRRDGGWEKKKNKGPAYMINNAWYGTAFKLPSNFSTSDINPTMISMHYSGIGKMFANRTENLRYLQEYAANVGPVGARDTSTYEYLQELQVPSYLSRCLTLMLQLGCQTNMGPQCAEKRDIVLNDVKDEALPEHISKQLKGAIKLSANMRIERRPDLYPNTFEHAFDLLKTYAHRAKFLITSRLHSALPAFAMGVPVIFVDTKSLPGGDRSRLAGIFDLLNVYIPGTEWTFDLDNPPPNPGVHLADRNRASFWNYLKRRSSLFEDTARLHGMIPLRRLGKDHALPGIRDTFHFVASAETLTWQFKRAIEHVFFHHPNAQVTVYSKKKLPELDIFSETGYNLIVEEYNLVDILKQVGTDSTVNNFLANLELRQDTPNWRTHEEDIVGLAALIKHGGVFLSTDMFVMKPLPTELNNAVGASQTGSFMSMSPQHNSGVAALQWILENYDRNLQSLSDVQRLLGSDMLINGPLRDLRVLQTEEISPFEKTVKECFTEPIDIDISGAYAVHLDASISKDYSVTKRGTTCDRLLHNHCIFCDELHTEPFGVANGQAVS